MELHPGDLVAAVIGRHRRAFGLIHGYLDMAVADAYSRLAGLRSDELGPHGLTVGGVVRDGLRERTSCKVFKQASLSVLPRPGNGVWLTDGQRVSIRIRKRPSDLRSGLPLRAVSDQDSLPDLGFSLVGQVTLVIFWSSSLKSGLLERVVLAAVLHVKDRNRLTILAEAELPHSTAASLGLSGQDGAAVAAAEEDDDHDEYWRGIAGEGRGGDEPA